MYKHTGILSMLLEEPETTPDDAQYEVPRPGDAESGGFQRSAG